MTRITRRAFAAFTAGAAVTVLSGGTPAHAAGGRRPTEQLRGMWIATVTDDDRPSAPALPADQQRAELTALFDTAAAHRLNTIYLQVRPAADAFWPSPYEPWSQYLTGTQGTSPGWDPLEFAVREAHRRGLQLHAWCNPYRRTGWSRRR